MISLLSVFSQTELKERSQEQLNQLLYLVYALLGLSIVIAALGSDLADGAELGALAAGYVLATAVVGPLVTRWADRIGPSSGRRRGVRSPG